MTLPASGPISLNQIAAEFNIANTTPFPSGFYGRGGAPGSGALGFADFYGRSGFTLSTTATSLTASTVNQTRTATVTSSISTTFSFSGTNAQCSASQTDATHALVTLTTPVSGSGSSSGTVRVTAANGDFVDVPFSATWP